MAKTFLIRNRHGVEVHVTEELARNMVGNPSVKILGEVISEKELQDVETPIKGGGSTTKKVKRFVAKTVKVIKDSIPGDGNSDVKNNGDMIKRETVITKSGGEVKKSKVLD